MKATTWEQRLGERIPPSIAREIEVYESQMELRRRGQLDEKVFAESRLRRGIYGQRYDNGERDDGIATRTLPYPSGDQTKGPNTLWDAPGMVRIKIPFGELDDEQLEVLAELADEVSDGILHVTTRQDFQLHFVHIDDTPDLMRRLAAVGITTREACGNSVRNVTGCPLSGVCRDETFDVTPYAKALAAFLLGHPDAQDFGRKFKISFSGCQEHACALARMHDIGLIAALDENGEPGFEMWVGGGLGAVPHTAERLSEFVPVDELLPTTQALCRLFSRLGEKRNRARARLKFLVAKLGIDEVRKLVAEEREELAPDPRWRVSRPPATGEGDDGVAGPHREGYAAWQRNVDRPLLDPAPAPPPSPETAEWLRTNIAPQRQDGYYTVTVRLPLGDLTSAQARALAAIARPLTGGRLRTTVEQNLLLRWIPGDELPALRSALVTSGLAAAGAGTLVDITACPGTDTCKLGISSSRGLAAELGRRIGERNGGLDEAIEGLRIKVSGCFNSCGQHHVADLGFYGVSRKVDRHAVPHFQVVLGGRWGENAGSYGLAIGAVPSKRIPDAVDRITRLYASQREPGESFQDFVGRFGKAQIKAELADLMPVPAHADDPSYYTDWSDAREYTLSDMGVGECAGEVVSRTDFGLAEAERVVFEAQLALERGDLDDAAGGALGAMVEAARALLDTPTPVAENDEVVTEFRRRFHDTGLFHDRFAGDKFARFLFRQHAGPRTADDVNDARRRVEEAQLFVEAAHAASSRLSSSSGGEVAG